MRARTWLIITAGLWLAVSVLTGPAGFGLSFDPVVTGEAAIVLVAVCLIALILTAVMTLTAHLRTHAEHPPTGDRGAAAVRTARARAAAARAGRTTR
ncbi:MAG: hypothetical protein AAGC63_15775 [Propionicimonas sp.]|nr:hypothetical protein [Propionicimonas sp.]